MKGFWGTVIKEMLILIRDIPGLVLLFALPMVLILVITLSQENAFKSVTDNKVGLVYIDNDKHELGNTIEKGLNESGYFEVIKKIGDKDIDIAGANKLIASGEYQVGIVVPEGSTKLAEDRADAIIKHSRDSSLLINSNVTPIGEIELCFDPAIRDSYKNSVTASLKRLIQASEFQILLNRFFEILPEQLNEQAKIPIKRELVRQLDLMEIEFNTELKNRMGEYAPADLKIEAPDKDPEIDLSKDFGRDLKFDFKTDSENLVKVKEVYAKGDEAVLSPTLVQNNVPAFALFAMFFIVIPLAGSMLTERSQGTYNRLRTLPVTYLTILGGKTFVYSIVCLSQMGIMILTGIHIIPAISDLPALDMGNSYFSIFIASVSSAMAAIGFGLIVGTVASSQSQAGMFGSFMVVILAILGGIFLPVYMMPEPLRVISMISPLRWGIDSFLDLFVRNGDLKSIWPNILRLNLFFVLALIIALRNFVRRK
jgi:ABC-2 type transport system permease protein